jgi:hypothetical protein
VAGARVGWANCVNDMMPYAIKFTRWTAQIHQITVVSLASYGPLRSRSYPSCPPRGVFCETTFYGTPTETNDGDTLGGPAHPIPVVSFGPGVIKGVETVGRFRVCDFPSPKIDSEFD